MLIKSTEILEHKHKMVTCVLIKLVPKITTVCGLLNALTKQCFRQQTCHSFLFPHLAILLLTGVFMNLLDFMYETIFSRLWGEKITTKSVTF